MTAAVVTGQATVTLAMAHAPVGAGAHAGIQMIKSAVFAGGSSGATDPVRCDIDAAGGVTSISKSGTLVSSTQVDPTQPIWLSLSMRNGIALVTRAKRATATARSRPSVLTRSTA